jgi:uncharacterized protein YuzE
MRSMTIAMTMTILAAGPAGAEEIALEETPAVVREAAARVAPGLKFYRVNREVEAGRVVYEFEAVGPRGEHMEIDIAEDGALDEIEMQIEADALPREVRSALDARLPGFEIAYVETPVRSNGVFTYEIEGQTAAGDFVSVDIREDGAVVSIEDAAMS